MNSKQAMTMVPIFFAFALSVTSAGATQPADLSGTWNVVANPELDTCGGSTTATNNWLVADASGRINAQVSGETNWPTLVGAFSAGELRIGARIGTSTTHLTLRRVSANRLEGRRISAVITGGAACAVVYAITATRISTKSVDEQQPCEAADGEGQVRDKAAGKGVGKGFGKAAGPDKTAPSTQVKVLDLEGPVGASRATPIAPAEKAEIAKTLARKAGTMKQCYEAALRHDPKVAGKVHVRFRIGTEGKVVQAVPGGAEGDFADCLMAKFLAIDALPRLSAPSMFIQRYVFSAGPTLVE